MMGADAMNALEQLEDTNSVAMGIAVAISGNENRVKSEFRALHKRAYPLVVDSDGQD